uniref:Uncharacterized protein n=1 Tax=Glossina brevipalpis TaxID=37001 RepID=A0A1A9W241_9MUSC
MIKLFDYFNSTTTKGRANVAKATCASFAILYLYHRLKKKALPQPVKSIEKPTITVTEKDSLTKCSKRENPLSDDSKCDKRNPCEVVTAGSPDHRNQSLQNEKSGYRDPYDERQSSLKKCEMSGSNNTPQYATPSLGGKSEHPHHNVLNSVPVKPYETIDVEANEDLKFSNEKSFAEPLDPWE